MASHHILEVQIVMRLFSFMCSSATSTANGHWITSHLHKRCLLIQQGATVFLPVVPVINSSQYVLSVRSWRDNLRRATVKSVS